MRALTSTPSAALRPLVIGVLLVALLLAWPAGAAAADPRLERAQNQRMEVQQRLNDLYQRLHAIQAEVDELEAELAALEAQQEAHAQDASAANSAVAKRARESYIYGSPDPTLALLVSGAPDTVHEQARLLGVLAVRSRGEFETASAARVRTQASAAEIAHKHERLDARRAEVAAVHAEVQTALAEAEAEERRVRTIIAREEAERRAAEERARQRALAAANQRVGRAAGAAGAPAAQQAPAAPSGSVACPVGSPRSYSDTWGAPRSGGRRHMGTDIMAPRGAPIYAYESGTVTRLWNSRLGGISLYLRGDSGAVYYYTHLQGYVAGLSAGQRVSVGEHIAMNGDTGNARGIPHLHFEVMPGGGGNVNPFPYVRRACG